jgi:hypothetical protein
MLVTLSFPGACNDVFPCNQQFPTQRDQRRWGTVLYNNSSPSLEVTPTTLFPAVESQAVTTRGGVE